MPVVLAREEERKIETLKRAIRHTKCRGHLTECQRQVREGFLFRKVKVWAIPPVRLGHSRRNSGKIPERPRKRSQSVSWNSPREYGWDPRSPIIQGIWGFQSISRILSPPQYGWGRLFFQKWFRRGPLRAGHGIPSSTEGIPEFCPLL